MTGTDALAVSGEDARIQAAIGKLRGLLVRDEHLVTYAVQRRIFALTRRRVIVAATSGRLIIYVRNLLPGARVLDIRWQDLNEAHIQEGIFGTSVALATDEAHVVTGLRKDEAQKLYRFCQEQEQAWREKNRVREMEEARAMAGGFHLGSALAGAANGDAHSAARDSSARLKAAKTMLDQGLISDAEFESVKAKILAEL